MKLFTGALCAFILFISARAARAADSLPKEITIGFNIDGSIERVQKGAVEIAQALQEEIGIPVNVFVPKNYSGMVEAMKNKKIDFAFFSAMTFVMAEKAGTAKVLLKKVWREPYYYSAILVKKDSAIKKSADLKNKKLALVDEKSTSGFLYPQFLIKQKKLKNVNIIMSGSHLRSVQMLERGEVDAIAVFSDDKDGQKSAWTKYATGKDADKNFRIIWLSEPIPNDPFCVRQDFYDRYPKVTHSLMFALIDIADKIKDENLLKEILGAHSFLLATSKQYDPIREMVHFLDLKLE